MKQELQQHSYSERHNNDEARVATTMRVVAGRVATMVI
jgi:hypothetical protein